MIDLTARIRKVNLCVGYDETNCIFKIIVPVLEEIGWSSFYNLGFGFEIALTEFETARTRMGFERKELGLKPLRDLKSGRAVATAVDIVVHENPELRPAMGYLVLEAKKWGDKLELKDQNKIRVYAQALGLPLGVLTNGERWLIYEGERSAPRELVLQTGNGDDPVGPLRSALGRESLAARSMGRIMTQNVLDIGYSRPGNRRT
jgi:hypothetical protein